MKKLKIFFNILYKEFLGKANIKKNKQQVCIYITMVLFFLFVSINFTPSNELVDYTALNDTIILGILQIFSITVIAYIFTYISIDFSYKLDMFFKTNFLDDIQLGSIKKILMIVGVQIVSIAIILIQAGIPLIQVLDIKSFIKFMIMTVIGINIVFIPIDTLVKYLERKYYQMGISIQKIRIIILSTLSIMYVTIYYTSLKVWFNYFKNYDFYYRFFNINLAYYILMFLISFLFISIYCVNTKNKTIMNSEINLKYILLVRLNKKTRYTKYLKLLIRNKKMFFIGGFIIGSQLLNYFTVSELAISNMLSFFIVIIGINFYSYLVHEKIFLQLNKDKDEYKIYFTLIIKYFIVNFLFILLSKNQYIYILESFVIYLVSIYLGIIFPRENNSLNKFMSNFTLGIIISILALANISITNNNIKLSLYVVGIVLISIINIRIIRRVYETKNI